MATVLERLVPWGPAFFGVLIFAPVTTAVMDAGGIATVAGVPAFYLALAVGLAWGVVAKIRGRWL